MKERERAGRKVIIYVPLKVRIKQTQRGRPSLEVDLVPVNRAPSRGDGQRGPHNSQLGHGL